MQTGGPTTTTTTITSTLFDTKINKQSQSINQSVNAPREPTPTPTPTEHTHSPTPLRRRSRRRRISREGSMFQALATLSLLLATATATANTDTDAAAQLQAEATGAALGSAATPFGSKQLTRCRQSCYQQVSLPTWTANPLQQASPPSYLLPPGTSRPRRGQIRSKHLMDTSMRSTDPQASPVPTTTTTSG